MKHTLKTHDICIYHASEDKDIVRKLAHILEQYGLSVWLDETMLKVGDSLRRSIDKALATCAYGLVVLSPYFFGKKWPERELDGLTARETSEGRKVIFPIWHNISVDEIRHYSPTLADKIGLPKSRGFQEIAAEIVDEVRSHLGKSSVATQMNKRKKISHNVEADVLTASKRRCAICYGIDRDLQEITTNDAT